MRQKVVFFDFGGVLVRGWPGPLRNYWEKRIGAQHGELATLLYGSAAGKRALCGETSAASALAEFGNENGLTYDEVLWLYSDFWHEETTNDEMLRLAAEVSERCKVAIMTNMWSDGRLFLERRFPLEIFGSRLVISSDVGYRKPDLAIFRAAERMFDVEPDSAILIDDQRSNVEGANAAGWHGIVYSEMVDLRREIGSFITSE